MPSLKATPLLSCDLHPSSAEPRSGPLLFRWFFLTAATQQLALFSLSLHQSWEQDNSLSSEHTMTIVIVPAIKQAALVKQKLPLFQGAAGEINTVMILGQILSK